MSFDPERFARARLGGHTGRLGLAYRAHGPNWVEMALPWSPDLIGDVERQVLASGPIIALMDVAASIAVWMRRDAFVPHATLDLRVDYLRPARAGHAVVGRGECYRLTRSVAFVRGTAHDGDPDDPVAHVAGTYMVLEIVSLPPYAAVLKLTVEPGETAPMLVMPFAEDVLGRPGFLHGGAIAGLLEMAALAALDQALAGEGGGRIKPINVTIDFRRGGRDKPTYASGRVTRLGTRIANVEATAWQDEPGNPIATARINCLIARE